jgi:hypothetical protein
MAIQVKTPDQVLKMRAAGLVVPHAPDAADALVVE